MRPAHCTPRILTAALQVRFQPADSQPSCSVVHNGRIVAPLLHISLLGPLIIDVDGARVDTLKLGSRKSRQLVEFLALQPAFSAPRERAMEALWPNGSMTSSVRNLDQALHVARRVLEDSATQASPRRFLRARGDLLVLGEPDDVWSDVVEFERLAHSALSVPDAVGEALCAAALELYRDDLLADDPFEAWVAAPRERLKGLARSVRVKLAAAFEATGRADLAADGLEHILVVDPLDEDIHVALMRLHARAGAARKAISQYERLRELSLEAFGSEPGHDATVLYRKLLAATSAKASAPSTSKPTRAPSNLPHALTRFIGRERESVAIHALLDSARLVTLTGMGGIGKTRLALFVAARLRDRGDLSVWAVECAAIPDPALLPQTIASALGVVARTGTPVETLLQEHLSSEPALLVVDNCDYVVDAAAALAMLLLTACPELRFLFACREPLRLPGEAVYHVSPLALPGKSELPAQVYMAESVRLFVDRAEYAAPGHAFGQAEAAHVATICRRLEGLPLAIELAAARLMHLSLEQILSRLADRFRLAQSTARTVDPRHRSLLAVLDSGFDLLDGAERTLFMRLSVFNGGWTLEAAESICSDEVADQDDARTPSSHSLTDVMGVLGRLVGRSLVTLDRVGEVTRYGFLETVREYAARRLSEDGEYAATALRHARWCLRLAEEARVSRASFDAGRWLVVLDAEHENLRAALRWTLREENDFDLGIRLAGALSWFWFYRGHAAEGRGWFDLALSRPRVSAAFGDALYGAARLADSLGEGTRAHDIYTRCLEVRRSLGDQQGIAEALGRMSWIEFYRGASANAVALTEEALAIQRAIGARSDIAASLDRLGTFAMDSGDLKGARRYLEEALALRERKGNVYGPGPTLHSSAYFGGSPARSGSPSKRFRGRSRFTARWATNSTPRVRSTPWEMSWVRRDGTQTRSRSLARRFSYTSDMATFTASRACSRTAHASSPSSTDARLPWNSRAPRRRCARSSV